MRVLRIHNRYLQRGGEDAVFQAEVELLHANGDQVQTIEVSNEAIASFSGAWDRVRLAAGTIWSHEGRRLVANAVADFSPEVVHVDNWFPLLSPSIYGPARRSGAAVVQTLHNYRLLCPNATMFRDGRPCEDCLGHRAPLPGIVHACYRDSRVQTGIVAATLAAHNVRRTWNRDVDRFIALTDFARLKFIEGGLPGERISVKPNSVDVPPATGNKRSHHVLFVGRLSPEKGIETLLGADLAWPLRIAGDGPLADRVREATTSRRDVQDLGRLSSEQVRFEMQAASALVFPSEWYEGFPVTIAESYANGLPVIASRLGAMAEVVEDGVTGLLFSPGDSGDLAARIRWAAEHPTEMQLMGENARRKYEDLYSPARSYRKLLDIYTRAIATARAR